MFRGSLNRNQVEKRFPVFDSERSFRIKYSPFFDYLEDDSHLENKIELYDFSWLEYHIAGAVFPEPIARTQRQNTEQFRSWFQEFFKSDALEKEQELKILEALLQKQYNVYANKIMSCDVCSEEGKREAIELWEKRTSVLIWDVFYKSFGFQGVSFQLRRDILKRALWVISRQKEDLMYPQSRFDVQNVLLYNLWGETFDQRRAALIKNTVGLSQMQKALLYNDENKEFFSLRFSESFEAGICLKGESEITYLSIKEGALRFLESLFNDYIKRLRRAGVYDKERTVTAIEQWKDVTVNEIRRMTDIDIVSSVLLSPTFSSVNDLREATVSRSEYDKICRISSFATNCVGAINGFVDDYFRMINDGFLVKSWSEKLESLRIDYHGLLSDLKNNHVISPDFDFGSFKEAFISADFASMVSSANGMDKIYSGRGFVGCIRQLIRFVGEKVGDEWYCTAAESSYVNSKTKHKGKEAKEAIGRLKPSQFYEENILKIFNSRIHSPR